LKGTLEKFFWYWNEETFEEGAANMAVQECSSDLEKLKNFCSKFLEAKNIVEISYAYAKARKLYNEAAQSIRSMQSDLFVSLAEFADMQAAILRIDRGIYTGYAPLMSSSAKELKLKTESILELLSDEAKSTTDENYRVLKENLYEKVSEDKIYADAIIIVAELYLDRWKISDNLDFKLAEVQNAVEELEAAGNERLASDLAPHIHVIKRFEDRRAKEGKLFIKNGEVAFYYYGSLDYRIREEFNATLKAASEPNSPMAQELQSILGSTQMVSEEMSDIWSGLSSEEFINTYKFRLHPLKIDGFREVETLEADVELKYYTMGVFEMKISFLIDNDYLEQDPEGLSLSGLRHLQSLGTPFALDEKIVVKNQNNEDISYEDIAEYVDDRFNMVSENIVSLFSKTPKIELLKDKKALTFDTEQSRFTLIRINQIVENFGDRVVRLRSQDFEKHFQYKALVMPVREVRSAIDNWIMYDSVVIDENLSGIRYNESEWFSINLHSCVVGLLEQPVWVFDQAVESAEVASAIVNLLNLSNTQAAEQLKRLNQPKEMIKSDLPSKDLIKKKKLMELEIRELDEFKLHLSNLLETVEAGSMMTYPDHTILMEKIFKEMHLDVFKKKALTLQAGLKDKRSKSMELIKKINDAVAYSQQKMIKLVVSIASVFIALGSLVDMFQLWSDAEMIKDLGLSDPSGNIKLIFVLTLAIASTSWLIYDNYLRDKKS